MIDTSDKRLIGSVIRLHPNDNVVVARVDVAIGAAVPGEHFTTRSQVPAGYTRSQRAKFSRASRSSSTA